ncbi:MAG: ferredoxin [Acidimicrobiia bacterium]|jgi:ferredoxin
MATVWIDGDACMGAGTCSQIAPDVFHERSDGTWAVKEDASHFGQTVIFDGATDPGHGPDGFEGRARVPQNVLGLVIDAAEECPGECIFVEA